MRPLVKWSRYVGLAAAIAVAAAAFVYQQLQKGWTQIGSAPTNAAATGSVPIPIISAQSATLSDPVSANDALSANGANVRSPADPPGFKDPRVAEIPDFMTSSLRHGTAIRMPPEPPYTPTPEEARRYEQIKAKAYSPSMTLREFVMLDEYGTLPKPMRSDLFKEVVTMAMRGELDRQRFLGEHLQ